MFFFKRDHFFFLKSESVMLSKLSKFGEYEKGETDKIPVGNIKAIQFGLLSPDAIQRQSVVEITNSEKPDGSDTKPGSLFDPHMGCNEKNHICKTCGHDLKDCQVKKKTFYINKPSI